MMRRYSHDPVAADFKLRYQQAYGEPPGYVAAQAAAAGFLSAEAHRRGYDHDQVRQWQTTTLLGSFALNETWRQVGHTPTTIQWRNGRQQRGLTHDHDIIGLHDLIVSTSRLPARLPFTLGTSRKWEWRDLSNLPPPSRPDSSRENLYLKLLRGAEVESTLKQVTQFLRSFGQSRPIP